MSDPCDLNANWRSEVTAPEYAALLRELDDLGCAFEWQGEHGAPTFLARCGAEVVGESDARPTQVAVYEVLDQAAEKLDVLA